MDGQTGIVLEDFIQSLSRVLPGPRQTPFTAIPWHPHVHLLVFIHRVEGLQPGIYCLLRDPQSMDTLHSSLDLDATWTHPESCLEGFLLWLLFKGDCRAVATGVSCSQDITSDGVYAVAMLGEYRAALEAWVPWFYKRLHWEAGVIGQLLYLEAEAIGIRSTGIGCFFDDSTHQAARLSRDSFQDIYHFTLGGPVEDSRLVTQPPYEHLEREDAEMVN